jgi:hypothetical protein
VDHLSREGQGVFTRERRSLRVRVIHMSFPHAAFLTREHRMKFNFSFMAYCISCLTFQKKLLCKSKSPFSRELVYPKTPHRLIGPSESQGFSLPDRAYPDSPHIVSAEGRPPRNANATL